MRKHYDFSKGKRNVHAKRLKKALREAERWDYIDGKPISEDPEYQCIYARMDVGNKLAERMHDAGLTAHTMSKASGINRSQILRTLQGDANLGINSMVMMFRALGCRVDFVVTPRATNEWETKRAIARLEARVIKKSTNRRK